MRTILGFAYEFVLPLVEMPAIRERIRFFDANLTPLCAALSLFIALMMWANI